MINMNLSALVEALDPDCREALEEAAGACLSRGGHEIGVEDYFEKLLPLPGMQDILVQFERSPDRLRELLEQGRRKNERASSRPVFSTLLIEFLQEAYLLNSLELRQEQMNVGALVLALLMNPVRYGLMPFYRELEPIPADALRRLLEGLAAETSGRPGAQPGGAGKGESYLQKYATDFTEEARSGKIDPVFARGPEIRQMVDILTRRRKNNPILVGDPGVGKTAVVEGLALRVAEGHVPDALKGVRIVGLDMGRLSAGASVKGEFEKRLKGVIDEVKASPVPTILFIDEAHTLVGSGNSAGSGDGANLLKPALARGELRTVAATTWSEYKKYFEKDAALARRFQLVKLDEPSLEETVTILRGIVPHYEKTHRVYVRDDSVIRTAELASRYISGRQLPDKAIDVLDTACARVRVSLGAKPPVLESMEEELGAVRRELDALERDHCHGVVADGRQSGDNGSGCGSPASMGRHASLQGSYDALQKKVVEITARWNKEKALVEEIVRLRTGEELAAVPADGPSGEPGEAFVNGNTGPVEDALETASESGSVKMGVPEAANGATLANLLANLAAVQGDQPMVFHEVSPSLVTGIVSEWTGVPMEKLTGGGEAATLAQFGQKLRQRIRGQEHALAAIEKSVLASQVGLENPDTPTGIFLLVGPSGVGKTETALAIADELFGGERFLISINMSEFQEKHTVSRLIGSPPGYVGYGEGGRLTEAVRRQPYSAILFDEVEKAHPDVLNLFYQVFDKGVLADGEGRDIDFRNTLIFMTSNLGSDIVTAMCEGDQAPESALLNEALRPALMQFFRPALLGRMTVVPYTTINPQILKELVGMKLDRVSQRLAQRHNIALSWSPEVVDNIAASCSAVDTGARNIDHIINASLLPGIATALLGGLDKDRGLSNALHIGLDSAGFTYGYGVPGGSNEQGGDMGLPTAIKPGSQKRRSQPDLGR